MLIPGTELLAEVRAVVPEPVEVIQVWDSLHPYSGWVPKSSHSERDAQRVQNNISRFLHLLDVLTERYAPGEIAAIVPLGLEKALKARWQEQGREGIRLGHFGAIRGQNAFSDVRCLYQGQKPG